MKTDRLLYEEYVVAPDNIDGSVPGIARTPSGDILAVYRSQSDVKEIRGVFSRNGAATWEDPFVIARADGIADPSLLVTDTKVVVHYSEILSIVDRANAVPQFRDTLWMQQISQDNGRTWSKASRVETGKKYCTSPHKGIVLRDGTLVWPFCWTEECESQAEPTEAQMTIVSSLMKSSDAGKTWVKGGDVRVDIPNGADEPSIVELSNGDLFMLVRTTIGRHYQSISKDRGKNWSTPTPSILVASNTPAALYRLSWEPNRILVVWDNTLNIHPANRFPLCVAVSEDDCRTWSHARVLTNPGCQVSYPGITSTKDGLVLVIWQQWLKKHFIYPPYTNIRTRLKCARFTVEWLEEGAPL